MRSSNEEKSPSGIMVMFSYLIASSMKILKGTELLELISPNSANQYFSLSPQTHL